jgi:predicted RNA-binding Zn-ribbon protein involved in translation (DUF1610 family)
MSGLETSGSLRELPRRRWFAFACNHCGGHELAWRSATARGRLALIGEMLLLEGESRPTIFGEYLIGPATDRLKLNQDACEWSCAKCGQPLVDHQGRCPTDFRSLIRCLSGTLQQVDPHDEDSADPPSIEGHDESLFLDQADESEDDEDPPDLRCPRCGHHEFIEQQEAVLFTPVEVRNGQLTWMYHERLVATQWDKLETYYH